MVRVLGSAGSTAYEHADNTVKVEEPAGAAVRGSITRYAVQGAVNFHDPEGLLKVASPPASCERVDQLLIVHLEDCLFRCFWTKEFDAEGRAERECGAGRSMWP